MSCLVASPAFSAPLLLPAVPLLSCISFVGFYSFLLSSLVCYSLCCMLGPFRMSFLILPVSLLSDVLSIAKTRGVCICSYNSRLNASKIPYPYVNVKAVINLLLEICVCNSTKRKLAEFHLIFGRSFTIPVKLQTSVMYF